MPVFFSASHDRLLFADHVLYLDASDVNEAVFDFEASRGVVDVVSETAIDRGEVANKIHRGTCDSMPVSDR